MAELRLQFGENHVAPGGRIHSRRIPKAIMMLLNDKAITIDNYNVKF